jgi:hypothetical protein
MLGIVAFLSVSANTNIERSAITAEHISSQRIYYSWNDIRDNFADLINASATKKGNIAEINDTLPSLLDIKSMLGYYQLFIEEYFEDGSIEIRFEDGSGNEINLEDLDDDPKIILKPMYINYSWPSFGKNQVFIQSSPENFSYIERVDLYIKLKNSYFDCDPEEPGDCNKWNPDNSVPSCVGITYCLDLNLTFEDSNGDIFNYPEHYFDIDDNPPKKSTTNLNIRNATANYGIFIQVGPLPLVLNIDLHNAETDSYTKLILNTTEFYINYPAVLNVTTPFGRKVDFL